MATSRKIGSRRAIGSVRVPPAAVPAARPGPPGGKRDANRHARVRALCEAATRLFLVRGLEAVRIDEITVAAGVAKGSFYRYFDDKAALVATLFAPAEAAIERALARCGEALAAAGSRDQASAAYVALALEVAGVVAEHADVVRLYLQERRAPGDGPHAPIRALAARLETAAIELTELAMQRGLLRVFPAAVSALAVIGAGEQLLLHQLAGRSLGAPAAVSAALVSLVMDGIRGG
jgi:AcrR family transcriptional regulator